MLVDPREWLLSLYLVGAACASEKWGGGVLIRLRIKTSPYSHWANYILNKTFSLEGEKPKIERKTGVRNCGWGT